MVYRDFLEWEWDWDIGGVISSEKWSNKQVSNSMNSIELNIGFLNGEHTSSCYFDRV